MTTIDPVACEATRPLTLVERTPAGRAIRPWRLTTGDSLPSWVDQNTLTELAEAGHITIVYRRLP